MELPENIYDYIYKTDENNELKYCIKIIYSTGSSMDDERDFLHINYFATDNLDIANLIAKLLHQHNDLYEKINSSYYFYNYKTKKENKVLREKALALQKDIEKQLSDYNICSYQYIAKPKTKNKSLEYKIIMDKTKPPSIPWQGYFEDLEEIEVCVISPDFYSYKKG